ncbi:helix-turn-helix domain-containing protein [Lachnospiraceae bacterium 66-29]
MNQAFGCCRLIYNKGFSMRRQAYENGNKVCYPQTFAMLTNSKEGKL